MPRYRPKHGTPFSQTDAAVICPEIIRLARENGGHITADELLIAARPSDSPLHDYIFSDSRAAAAEKWYRHKAAKLLRSFEVVWTQDREERTAPLMSSLEIALVPQTVPPEDDEEEIAPGRNGRRTPRTTRAYVSVMSVMDDTAYQRQLVARAREELQQWRHRHAEIRNLVDFRTRFGRTYRQICNLFPEDEE